MRKKLILLLCLTCLLVSGCADKDTQKSTEKDTEPAKETVTEAKTLEEVTESYSLEEAIKDGCLVVVDGTVVDGEDSFDAFRKETEAGRDATLRVVQSYTDPGAEGEDNAKDKLKSMLLISDVIFTKEDAYKVRYFDGGKEYNDPYPYLLKSEFKPEGSEKTCNVWYLCTREDKSYEELMQELMDSEFKSVTPNFFIGGIFEE